jgi:hypothetical protein
VVLGVIFVVLASWESEPRYKGKSLSEWMEIYNRGLKISVDREQAASALRQIGTNGVACVLKWLPYKESALRGKIRNAVWKLPISVRASRPVVWLAEDTRFNHAEWGGATLLALGPDALQMALPRLNRLMREGNSPSASQAMRVLGQLGTNGLPLLLAALSDRQFTNRALVVFALCEKPGPGTNAAPAVPSLIECLTNKQPSVRQFAAIDLGLIGAEPGTAVPALVRGLRDKDLDVRRSSAVSLRLFGKAATPAVPALLDALDDPAIHQAVADVLGDIAPEELQKYQETHKPPPADK